MKNRASSSRSSARVRRSRADRSVRSAAPPAVMPADDFQSRPAVPADTRTILALMRAFYAEERLAFDETRAHRAVAGLLDRPALGTILMFEAAGRVVGHGVLTFGFSLEFHGRYVLLDELYLIPDARGRGWGRRSLALAEAWARSAQAGALRLELNRANIRARALYLATGFTDDRRDLFTKRLVAPGPLSP